MFRNLGKKMWYRNEEMVLRGVKRVSKVTFSISKFLIFMRNNQTISININNVEQMNERGIRSAAHSREKRSRWKKFKQSTISWLDRKENAISACIDEKIYKCREAYSRLSQNVLPYGVDYPRYDEVFGEYNELSDSLEEVGEDNEPPRYDEEVDEYNALSTPVACELLERGVKVDALMKAASVRELEVVKYLLEKGADVNAKDKYGNTEFMKAASMGRLKIVKYLLEKGACRCKCKE